MLFFCLADILPSDPYKKDLDATQRSYNEAAIAGSVDAFYDLIFMFCRGDGVERDYHVVYQYYSQATDREFRQASNNLTEMHIFGQGVQEDLVLVNSYNKVSEIRSLN